MIDWQKKYVPDSCLESTAKTANTPTGVFQTPQGGTAKTENTHDPSITSKFVQLVRITGICERGFAIDERTILTELDADDLAELTTLDTYNKQCWAQLLAHRLCDIREGKRPPRPRGSAGGQRQPGRHPNDNQDDDDCL